MVGMITNIYTEMMQSENSHDINRVVLKRIKNVFNFVVNHNIRTEWLDEGDVVGATCGSDDRSSA
jgi:hypothetical protein